MQGVQTFMLGKRPTMTLASNPHYRNIENRIFKLPSMTIRLYIWMLPWSSPLFLEQIGEWHNETIN